MPTRFATVGKPDKIVETEHFLPGLVKPPGRATSAR